MSNNTPVVINKDNLNEKTMVKADILQEGIISLTDFLVEIGEIPSKESIINEYDKIIPDSWENVRSAGKKMLMETDDIATQVELLTPVLPNFSYKYSIRGMIYRTAVNVDTENNEYHFYMYCTNQGWGFHCHFVVKREDDVQNFTVTQLEPWFVYMFYHMEKKRWKSDKRFQKYLPKDYETHEELYDITKFFFYSVAEKENIENLLMEIIADFQYLMVYMNHQIELEVLKREELIKKELESKKVKSEEKTEQVENKIIYHENGRKENHTVLIGDLKIHIASKSGTKASKIIHRKCLCWGVRGHKRFYKSGKVVYIKPYKKGRDKDKIAAMGKEYNIVGV